MVHVAYQDARGLRALGRQDLPTEAEWEFAARGGLDGAEYAWGDEFTPGGRYMANTWQGDFPLENRRADGYARTSPVGAFPPNGYGLYDMIGNVWEWTTDWYSAQHERRAGRLLHAENPRGGAAGEQLRSAASRRSASRARCSRAARTCARRTTAGATGRRRGMPQPVDTSTCHVGFRCIVRGSRE